MLGVENSWLTPGGRLLRRLDVFLSEPLRRAPPEDLGRYRLLILISLGLLLLNALSLLALPWSPEPWVQGPLAILILGVTTLALARLRRQCSPQKTALLVCSALAVALVFICTARDLPYSASHAATMLLPALSVYLVGARLGFFLTLPVCLVLGVLHPMRYTLLGSMPRQELVQLWILDVSAAIFMLGIWGVCWMHASALDQARVSREQALRTLHESEHKLRTLIENTDDLVCSMDMQGRIIIANSAMRDYCRARFGREIHPGESLLSDDPQHRQMEHILQRVLHGQSVRLEDGSLESNPPKVLEISVKPVLGEDGQMVGVTLFGRDVTERREAEHKLTEMHRSLVDVSRQAGMAEVVTGLLHNVGNTLNSINVSVHLVTERIRASRVGSMVRAAELIHTHREALGRFLEQDPRGQQLPSYMLALSRQLVEEQQALLAEQRTLTDALDHVKSIIGMQQEHARVSAPVELVKVSQLIDDALRLHAVSFQRSGIDIRREYEQIPPILLDRHKLLQILLNLLSNARHALLDSERDDKRITIRLAALPDDRVRIQVSDNGQGISPEHLTRMFTQGFTTKKDGHGFGLHISALAAIEMAGTLSCESEGPGLGATFTIDLPMQSERPG
ncbi:ATP-binding protein [Cystobacter fuscus]|nr:ATP-binding protein [Cystobacter fuscus]